VPDCAPCLDGCRVVLRGRPGQRGAQRPRSGAGGALDAAVREADHAGGRTGSLLVLVRDAVVADQGGGLPGSGVSSGRGSGAGARVSQAYLGPRGARCVPAT